MYLQKVCVWTKECGMSKETKCEFSLHCVRMWVCGWETEGRVVIGVLGQWDSVCYTRESVDPKLGSQGTHTKDTGAVQALTHH